MRFRVLGPVVVSTAQRSERLPRAQTRGLLALLLLNPGQRMSRDAVMESMWGGAVPATARSQVSNAVTVIRRHLTELGAPGILTSHASGYQLNVAPEDIDVACFDELVARARAEAARGDDEHAAARLHEALGLWTGAPLADAAGFFVEGARSRLVERRLTAIEDLADIEVRVGRADAGAARLGALTDAYPLRERLRYRQMTALYHSGRQREALHAYRDYQTRLAEDEGLDPGPDLRRLHQRILAGDVPVPTATAAAPDITGGVATTMVTAVPAQLPADLPGFTGRAGELLRLDAMVDASTVAAPATLVCTVSGTAGVGKTTLAVHWAYRMIDRFPDGQLHVNLRGFDPGESAMSPAEAVRGFLDALHVPAQSVPTTPQAQVGLYRSLLAGRRMLILLDNARDADQVRPLLPGAPGCLVLVTSRNHLSGLVATENAKAMTLDLLPTDDARQLLRRRLGESRVAVDPKAVEEIIARCARLPLALAIVAARALSRPELDLRTLAGQLRDPEGQLEMFASTDPATDVRRVFSWSYEALSDGAARMFRYLGTSPAMTIGIPAAASLAGLPPATARRLLDELTEAHLLVELADGRFTFHDLLRAYSGELARSLDPPPGLRRATRRLLAHYLHTAYRADHLLSPLRDRISVPPPGPDVTMARPEDHDAALAWFRSEHVALLSVLHEATDADLADHVWRLTCSIANFLERQGHWTDLVATQTLGLETARRLGDWTAQARSHRALGRVYCRLARHDEAHRHLQRALDLYTRIGDVTGQAYTYLNISVVLGEQRRHAEALRDGHRAHELFVRADHRVGQALTLNTIGWCEAQLRDYRQALKHCQQALALHREVGDRTGEADTWDSLAFAHLGLGDHEQATASYRRALDLFREFGDRFNEAVTLEGLGRVHVATGDLPAADRAWRRALAILDDLGHPEADRVRTDLERLALP